MNYTKVMMDAINNASKTKRPMPSAPTKKYPGRPPNSYFQKRERSRSRMKQRNPKAR